MSEIATKQEAASPQKPLTFVFAKWQGYVLAGMYLLYGGVKMIFGWLDHDFNGFGSFALFFGFGALLILLAFAFRDLKVWGWYGLIVFNGLAVVGSLITLSDVGSPALLLLSLLGLTTLLWPSTRQELLGR